MFLPDVNAWLALAFDGHLHHTAAKIWYEGSSGSCFLCRLTQQGFLRLASNPAVLREQAVSLRKAWDIYDVMVSDARIAYAEEPDGMEDQWRAFTRRRTFSPKVWNDAYLAAFARCANLKVVTFDQGLSQYKGVACSILS